MNIYVANKGDDTITWIKNKQLKKNIKVYSYDGIYKDKQYNDSASAVGPHKLILNKNLNILYSLNVYDNSISIIDLKNFDFIKSIYVGLSPNDGIIFDNYIFISCGDTDCINIFDITSEKVIAQINVGSLPQRIIYSNRYKKAFVANMNSESVTIVDPINMVYVKDIILGSRPCDICLSKDEKYLFISNINFETGFNGNLKIYDIFEEKVIKTVDCGRYPISIVYDNDNIYIADSYLNTLRKIDLSTLKHKEIFSGYMPSYILVNDRNIVMSVTGEDSIFLIYKDSLKIENRIRVGKEPEGLIIEA